MINYCLRIRSHGYPVNKYSTEKFFTFEQCISVCWVENKMIFLKNILFLGFLICFAHSAKLPSNFQRCKRRDQICLKKAIQDAIPKFAGGFKSLGVPSLDPLFIPLMEIPGGSGVVRINQKVRDGKLYGLSKAQIDHFLYEIESGKVEWTFRIPNITIKANYEMTGQILVLPVKGKGKMEVVLEDVNVDEKVKLVSYTKNNELYRKVADTSLKMEAGHVHFNLENVFDGNKELSDQINQVMNDNWKTVFDEIKEGYNDAIRRFCDNIVNEFFGKIPENEVYLD